VRCDGVAKTDVALSGWKRSPLKTMKIGFEKLTQPFGIFLRKFLRACANFAETMDVTASRFSLGAKMLAIKVSG
jgi:hypothetical protein